MVMESLARVVIDTSALILMCEGYDFFDAVEKNYGKVEYLIPTNVIKEIEHLAENSTKYQKNLNFIMRLIQTKNIRIIETGNPKQYADDDLLSMSASLFITTDMELAKKLKDQGKKVFVLKQRRYYDYY